MKATNLKNQNNIFNNSTTNVNEQTSLLPEQEHNSNALSGDNATTGPGQTRRVFNMKAFREALDAIIKAIRELGANFFAGGVVTSSQNNVGLATTKHYSSPSGSLVKKQPVTDQPQPGVNNEPFFTTRRDYPEPDDKAKEAYRQWWMANNSKNSAKGGMFGFRAF